ncbi:FAD-linked oxidase C-terminal domain-containing protein [Flavobacterium sp. Fl-77]|uniref:FAD-linked oxidase C-terminal domain-containing protein n=1 Tax=Flavobacterium flavipigmentatum TaxID=2893884 RepID=A0AAJ2SD43_9FLAO|nr:MULTISPECIES: FAD-binding and (Fe-S)-binding domain-containing protein [unclassified Flavobacterium]MDX6181996.1 FAD-linked oxidase C-terminal domain-containing protein [Flavobacterium sp. Fl-33]MDX6186949.1 FAD-linked oxidase C-terminal domain-containing protein [Flavobacterium sp. Fl-77]UFH37083.1 FAD-binding protein [Flavobacterium sp. F-70]
MSINKELQQLSASLEGTLLYDDLHKTLYSTDASVYRIKPKAVAIPKTNEDISKLIRFAAKHHVSVTPRTAGTSLAGQTVGDGIVVDVSKNFTKILSFNLENKTVTVQPGVIRDELNLFLKPYGVFFGPNTSTSNRCMIGGMVGNNSSGTTSIRYGVTRDKIVAIKAILSDGSEVVFNELTSEEFIEKTKGDTLENKIYKSIYEELSNKATQEEIIKEFPKPEIHRRNTGYAVDILLKSDLFGGTEPTINLGKLLCGSEGTLAFTTEVTLKVDDLPPAHNIMVVAHYHSIQESLESVVVAMKHHLYTCEMIDDTILDCTKTNREQFKNRFFLVGEPKAIMMFEVASHDRQDAENQANALIEDLEKNNFGYALVKIYGPDIDKVNELRKAGLGLLGSIVGDNKAADSIEDTAVELSDLPNYIAEFSAMMLRHGQEAIYYAHAGAGELHLRPVLNLKKTSDLKLFRTIATDVAILVKKYRGSLSGEHGDGIVRGEFIPFMIGDTNYELLKRIKLAFDPNSALNIGKIVNALKMDENHRVISGRVEPNIKTFQDFSDSLGILRAAEKCNGSGDCRKLPSAGGAMCPSYRATKNEKETTRARANALREYLTYSEKENKFDQKELYEVFELCVSCKACASECPSNVDVATLKAEFLYQYQKANGFSTRNKIFAHNAKLNKMGSLFPSITNFISNQSLVKKTMGIAPEREVPLLARKTFRKWHAAFQSKDKNTNFTNGRVYLFVDEFTNYYDVNIGIDAFELLSHLGYEVLVISHEESGRAYLSKGFLEQAKKIANTNIQIFKDLVSSEVPLIGIEPSAILTFRDEYLRLADDKASAEKIAKSTFTIEEFFKNEITSGNITADSFSTEKKEIKIHGHCHQKSLSAIEATFAMLNLPINNVVTIYNSGCCGMAGSFGYEKEHYGVSMQMGEDTLFPKVRATAENIKIAAAGTSCRHQIYDGTSREAQHPVTILRSCLK